MKSGSECFKGIKIAQGKKVYLHDYEGLLQTAVPGH